VKYSFSKSWDGDAHNYMGRTTTPIIFKNMTILGNGATLQWTDNGGQPENFRLFAVGSVPSSGPLAISVNGTSYSGTGSLTLQMCMLRTSMPTAAMALRAAVVVLERVELSTLIRTRV
jgi:hypothetical protein